MSQSESRDRLELKETLTSFIAEHGFPAIIEELRNYSLESENEIGLPEELQQYWNEITGLLEQILEIEVEDYEPK